MKPLDLQYLFGEIYNIVPAHKTGSLLKMCFALSNRPHFHCALYMEYEIYL